MRLAKFAINVQYDVRTKKRNLSEGLPFTFVSLDLHGLYDRLHYFQRGHCNKGDRCQFRHDNDGGSSGGGGGTGGGTGGSQGRAVCHNFQVRVRLCSCDTCETRSCFVSLVDDYTLASTSCGKCGSDGHNLSLPTSMILLHIRYRMNSQAVFTLT